MWPCIVYLGWNIYRCHTLIILRSASSSRTHLFTSSVIEYANTARASLPGAERVRLHVSAFNSAPDCKRLLSAIGLFDATWSRTHLVYRWNIPTIQTVWGEPKLNHSLYRQLQPGRVRGRVWVCLQNAVVTAANSHINNYYKNIISLQPVGPLSLVSPWASAPWSPCINAPLPIWVFGSRSAFTVTPEVFSWD